MHTLLCFNCRYSYVFMKIHRVLFENAVILKVLMEACLFIPCNLTLV